LGFFQIFFQRLESFDFSGKQGSFFQDGLGLVGIIPEIGPGDLFFDFLQAGFFSSDVKDNLGVVRFLPRAPSTSVSDLPTWLFSLL